MKLYWNSITMNYLHVFCLSIIVIEAAAERGPLSDSILDIIDTKYVEQILADRRANETRLSQRISHTIHDFEPEVVDFEVSSVAKDNDEPLIQYNDTAPHPSYFPKPEDFRGNKYLKSSKNALYITRKEYLKKDWCKSEPLVQRIKEDGCISRTIMNRFCYGQCNSFYIPKGPRRRRARPSSPSYRSTNTVDLEEEDLTTAAFKSCTFCKPKKTAWITITLRCPSLSPPFRRKRVQRIKQCRCMAVPIN